MPGSAITATEIAQRFASLWLAADADKRGLRWVRRALCAQLDQRAMQLQADHDPDHFVWLIHVADTSLDVIVPRRRLHELPAWQFMLVDAAGRPSFHPVFPKRPS